LLEASKLSDSIGVKACLLAMAARTDTTSYLEKITVPVLLLCGEDDNKTPPPVMKSMADKIKLKEFYIINNAGHLSPVENPEEVNTYIERFLRKVFK
jgi:pimeloyl-ACP methyl ester carboxylesterase